MKIKKFEFYFEEKRFLDENINLKIYKHKINGYEIKFKKSEIRFARHPYLSKQKFYNQFNSYNEHRTRYQFCFFKRWSIAISVPLKLKECY